MKRASLLLLLLIQVSVYSQSCFPDGVDFLNQYQIDQFSSNYPDCERIEGPVLIGDYAGSNSITSLQGLSQIKSFGSHVSILTNQSLLSLSGLDSVTSIDGYLFIWQNTELTNLDELSSLATIGNALAIIDNDHLISLEGLSSLTSVGAELSISNNSILPNLNGLEQLTSINTFIDIINNESLTDISGIRNIDPTSINRKFTIIGNNSLSLCSNQLVCDFISISIDSMIVSNNAESCNNISEIETGCDTLSVFTLKGQNEMVVFPNPATDYLSIFAGAKQTINEVVIYDISGKKILSQIPNNSEMDISSLNQGVFIVEVIFNRSPNIRQLFVKK